MRRIVAGSTGDAAARMRAGAAQVESIYRRAVLRPARNGAHEEKLIERQVTMKNISFGQAVSAFEIERR